MDKYGSTECESTYRSTYEVDIQKSPGVQNQQLHNTTKGLLLLALYCQDILIVIENR